MQRFIDRIVVGDCLDYLPELTDESIHCFVSDIPYGISLDAWDVLHANTNSALLGQSPAQAGKMGFKRRGKPIQGWCAADRNIPRDYEAWCRRWATLVYDKLKPGASLFIFGARRTIHRAIVALEDTGFLLRDVLSWEKPQAHYRAQRLSGVLERRGMEEAADHWMGWRLGNLSPRWEPIAWFFKPYKYTITDNVLEHDVGAINTGECHVNGKNPSNILSFWYEPNEPRLHEAQKPLRLIEFLITLTTREDHIVLDPFIGSGTTAVACRNLGRRFIGFEINPDFAQLAERRLQNGH